VVDRDAFAFLIISRANAPLTSTFPSLSLHLPLAIASPPCLSSSEMISSTFCVF
jgi:hypothetical protein